MARIAMTVAARQGLNAIPKNEAAVAAAQVYKAGAVLTSTAGELVEGGANPTSIVGVAIHAHPPTNNVTETGYYIPARPNIEFLASIDTNAALGTGAIAQADLFAAYGITEDVDGIWYVDKAKTGAGDVRVRITKFQDAVGTVNGRVRVQFLPTVNAGAVIGTIYGGN